MWEIDNHIHTIFSDGQLTGDEAVLLAKENGLKQIAITDHDGIWAIRQAAQAGEKHGIKVVSGIEVATEYEGRTLHILGYNFDENNEEFAGLIREMSEAREKRNEKLLKALDDMGYNIKMEELLKGRNNNFVGKPVIARKLEEKGYIAHWEEAFEPGKLLESDTIRAIKKSKPKADRVINIINEAGGVSVLAHPIQIKRRTAPDDQEFYKLITRFIKELAECGLYGIECYHPDQNKEQTLKMIDIAQIFNLKISRGTDLHYSAYSNARTTWEYIEEGNKSGYGKFPEDFIDI